MESFSSEQRSSLNSHTRTGSLLLSLCHVVFFFLARGKLLLTQADVVVEESEEVAALFPVVAARCARAPGSHVGCGVVKVVGSYCASCGESGRKHKSVHLQPYLNNTDSHRSAQLEFHLRFAHINRIGAVIYLK